MNISKLCFLLGRKFNKEYSIITPTSYNVKFYVDFNDSISSSIYNKGFFDKTLTEYIINNIKESDVVLDVGANLGWMTCLFASKAKKVHAFECNSEVYNQLVCNVHLNNFKDKTSLYEIALSDKKGESEFTRYAHSGHGHLESNVRYNTYKDTVKVKTDTIDNIISEKVDFIKVDVEGFEYNVLKGAKNTISKYKPDIFLEYNNNNKIVEYLKSLGYDFFIVGENQQIEKADFSKLKGRDNILCKEK